MAHRERSWIDNLNPRELEIKLANRGLVIPGTADEQRRRLRHFERTRSVEVPHPEEIPANPNATLDPNESTSTLSATGEIPTTQNNGYIGLSRDAQADGAIATDNNEDSVLQQNPTSIPHYTGTIPRVLRDITSSVDNQVNPDRYPHPDADSTIRNSTIPNPINLADEGLPPPNYETLTANRNFQEPHSRHDERRYRRSHEIPHGQYSHSSQRSQYEFDRRQVGNDRNYPNRGTLPRHVPGHEVEFEREFAGISLRESDNRRSSRPNMHAREEDFRFSRGESDNQSRNERPRVCFNSNAPYNNARIYEGSYQPRSSQLPRTAEFPFRRSYPNSAAQAYDIMRKWDLKFSGARKEDPDMFLRKIRSGRAMIFVGDEDLLNLLPFFLGEIATRWYDVNRNRWTSFEDFAVDCKNRFSDPDYQFELMQDIHRRTQGEYESVADFLTCMLSMFDKLSPRLTEYEEINFAHRNLLPRLHLTIPRNSISNFAQFEHMAVSIEKSFRVAQSYQPPPKPEGTLLPDLAYHGPSRTITRRREQFNLLDENISDEDDLDTLLMINHPPSKETNSPNQTPQRNNKSNQSKKPSEKEKPPSSQTQQTSKFNPSGDSNPNNKDNNFSPVICWNCDQLGHRHNSCKEPKNIICYGCGHKNVIKPKCPNCAGKEKQNR